MARLHFHSVGLYVKTNNWFTKCEPLSFYFSMICDVKPTYLIITVPAVEGLSSHVLSLQTFCKTKKALCSGESHTQHLIILRTKQGSQVMAVLYYGKSLQSINSDWHANKTLDPDAENILWFLFLMKSWDCFLYSLTIIVFKLSSKFVAYVNHDDRILMSKLKNPIKHFYYSRL